jgi:hypothetical protein
VKTKLLVTLGAALVIVVRLLFPGLKVDTGTVALLLLAILPWISTVVKSAEIPGGWKIEFQDVKVAGEKVTGRDVAAPITPTAGIDAPAGVIDTSDPNLALVALRLEIETRLRALARHKGIPFDGTLRGLNEDLRRGGVLHAAQASGLLDLIEAGNAAAHGAHVSPLVADWAARYGPGVLQTLDWKLSDLGVRHPL